MPELPEVETIRRQMERVLKGQEIREVEVLFAGRLNVSGKIFSSTLRGAKFTSVQRRAKLLIINFSNGWTVVTHLKMTGKFLIQDRGTKPGPHTHVVFHLTDGRQLFFDDVRKFGYLKLVRTAELEEKILAKEAYGPEPLEKDFSFELFKSCLQKHPIKK